MLFLIEKKIVINKYLLINCRGKPYCWYQQIITNNSWHKRQTIKTKFIYYTYIHMFIKYIYRFIFTYTFIHANKFK